MSKTISRAERLELARKIRRLGPEVDMEAYLRSLTPADVALLREAVDWVVSYEMADMLAQGQRPGPDTARAAIRGRK